LGQNQDRIYGPSTQWEVERSCNQGKNRYQAYTVDKQIKFFAQRRKGAENGGRKSEDRHREGVFGNLRFRSTFDIIEAAEGGSLPDKVMLNVHPQRWDDRLGPWVKELVWQNIKNVVKKYFFVKK